MAIQVLANGLDEQALSLLAQPLDVSQVKERPGGNGRKLKYIKGDTAIDTANRIFGFGKWGYRIVSKGHQVIEDDKKGRIEFYTAEVELSVAGAMFPFPGDGIGIVTAPFTVEMHEKAYKEASTDALKRALRHYGDQFGLSLYDEDDYLDNGDGTLVRVGEARVGKAAHAPRQIVEAHKAPQLSAPVNTPASTENTLKSRLNAIYSRSLALHQFEKGATSEESVKNFLVFASEVIGATIAAPGQLTMSRLDAIEAYLDSKEQ